MAASASDKLRKSYSFLQKSLNGNITDSDTTITLNNTTSIPTDTAVDFIIDRVDSNGNRTNSTREIVSGVVSGSTIINCTRGLHGTTAQSHTSGAVVEFVASGPAWNDLIDHLRVEHNQDGTHGAVTATSLATDTITEDTAAAGVTIDGLLIKDSKLATNNSVVTANITNAAVTADKLSTGASTAEVATAETTATTTYTDLATSGPAVTVTIGANGLALVCLFAAIANGTINANSYMGFAVSGASTVAASDAFAVQNRASDASTIGYRQLSAVFLVTGLTAGSNTFTSKYRVNTGTGGFATRKITVIPL